MKDFGDILNQWENLSSQKKKKVTNCNKILSRWLENNEIVDKDKAVKSKVTFESSPKNIKIDDRIDLHNMTISEATVALNTFVQNAAQSGMKKILIVHGKGIHSPNGGVLKSMVRQYIEKNPLLGTSGEADKTEGGSGATWVIIRNKKK
jgi:DNA-nicking Smr family endonuclease